jgi:signal transduction histidine kinase
MADTGFNESKTTPWEGIMRNVRSVIPISASIELLFIAFCIAGCAPGATPPPTFESLAAPAPTQMMAATVLAEHPPTNTVQEMQSLEVTMPGERVYLATASSIAMDDQRIGRVCILQDVTHFKALDSLKSEFVSTVSHDLRSPLSLIRGYATMLEMVGDLNEQQTNYVRKIMGSIESMVCLVNNLLDLGRIEAGVGLRLGSYPVKDILETVVGAFQLQATQRQI